MQSHVQGKVTISNDGATIMKLLEIVHPAAKSLVDVSLAQDAEVRFVHDMGWSHGAFTILYPHCLWCTCEQVGDGTTSVVILAAEFLKEAKPFIEEGGHPRVGLVG